MKKLLALTLSLASIAFVAPSASAADSSASAATNITANAASGQVIGQGRWGRRINRRARVVTQTRFVRYGRRVFRETYQVIYLPNGRMQTRLISRVRVR